MDRRVALAIALTTAGLAVALVAADLQFNVTVSLETQREGAWVTVASQEDEVYATPSFGGRFGGCAGPDMRIVIDNGLPWATNPTVEVRVLDHNSGRSEGLVAETPTVARGETHITTFTVPAWAMEPTTAPDGSPTGPAYLEARIGDAYLSTCVGAA